MVDAFERAAERAETESRQRRHERWSHAHRKGFRIHATVFVAVQILILAVWVLQWRLGGTTYPWFVYVLLGWGVGLAAHYAAARDSFKRRD
jgi:hypothetical protein